MSNLAFVERNWSGETAGKSGVFQGSGPLRGSSPGTAPSTPGQSRRQSAQQFWSIRARASCSWPGSHGGQNKQSVRPQTADSSPGDIEGQHQVPIVHSAPLCETNLSETCQESSTPHTIGGTKVYNKVKNAKTGFLANRVFACVTPALFVISSFSGV